MNHPDKLFGRLGNRLFQMAYIYAQMRDGIISDIYVQDPDYFDRYRDEIRGLFGTPKRTIDFVAMHVRRGDYVGNPFYVDLFETEYYREAINHFPEDTIMVFSDDIEWCREHFKGTRFTFDESDSEIESLGKMSSCKGIITANSSFSWWSAYLSNCGKVVAPSVDNWYTSGEELTKCPDEWIRI